MTLLEEINSRIAKLQMAMREKEIDGALLIQRADLYYFSGTGQNAHLLVPAEGKPALLVKKSLARARQESPLERVEPFKGEDELALIIKDILPSKSKIGLETDVLPAKLYFRYQKLFSDYSLVDISSSIRKIRAIKSEYEIDQMRRAARMSESVFNHACQIIKAGMTEVELAGQLELHARTLGHQGAVRMRAFNQELYFGHILTGENAALVSFFDGPTGGSGLNPSYPQGAGLAPIKPGEPILVDFVSIAGGYMVDQTRIFCIDSLPLHLNEAYQRAVDIKEALISEGKAGVSAGELFLKAEQIAEKVGLANHFMGYVEKINFIGHGVGIELDELPVIARGLNKPLEEGMVFALEPKFIFPGEGTVGIEDTMLVGCNRLTQITRLNNNLIIV